MEVERGLPPLGPGPPPPPDPPPPRGRVGGGGGGVGPPRRPPPPPPPAAGAAPPGGAASSPAPRPPPRPPRACAARGGRPLARHGGLVRTPRPRRRSQRDHHRVHPALARGRTRLPRRLNERATALRTLRGCGGSRSCGEGGNPYTRGGMLILLTNDDGIY